MRMVSQLHERHEPDAGARTDNRLFIMFHGYGNDETEMVRIINAVYDLDGVGGLSGTDGVEGTDDSKHKPTHDIPRSAMLDSILDGRPAANAGFAAKPSYLSFRGTYARPYMGGNYWYPDGCDVELRRHECAAVGNTVTSLLDASLFAGYRKILIGFSQGGYLSYRLVKEHPNLFDAAILLSPSFKGEEQTELRSPTRFFLAYGSHDRTIPLSDQRTAYQVLGTGHLAYHEYPGMAHAICDQEIADIRKFLIADGRMASHSRTRQNAKSQEKQAE
jgi:phospholipase/carboxylesterase